jgi:hypothetical protein
VPENERISAKLQMDISSAYQFMLRVHYFEEAHWLWMASAFPQHCRSRRARTGIESARWISMDLGFSSVTRWLDNQIHGEYPQRSTTHSVHD